ncbi:hypothetical protein PAXINDRAFT_14037 [Paxillus involutus ATCC 200175]|uniref:Uncharacterized protein n=1 Tax=Paxillus involutus ATCC 200175 TaxID=664439 RepID=A0A0C9U0Y6_PAXIN|nr:hypothetical protein PAXINDRAFT_14037 [Paxillus involutus ATCC 200175]
MRPKRISRSITMLTPPAFFETDARLIKLRGPEVWWHSILECFPIPPANELPEDSVLTPSHKDRVIVDIEVRTSFAIYESSSDWPDNIRLAGLAYVDSRMACRSFLGIFT